MINNIGNIKVIILALIAASLCTHHTHTFLRLSFATRLLAPTILVRAATANLKTSSFKDSIKENTRLGNRPLTVQAAVDKAFEENKDATSWGLYNGDWHYYTLLGLDEDLLFERLAHENPRKKDIYIIDAGCAQGGWGKHAMSVLHNSTACKKSGKRFHILSITGGQECEEQVRQKDHVTLYQMNQFKIENIDEELAKRDFDLKDKVDLIVSHWALRHLVDPFGTLKRMYSLLTPDQGKLMSNGFLFKFNDSDKVHAFPINNEHILAHANTIKLFRYYNVTRDTGQFLLVRDNKNGLELPLKYTGNTHFIGYRWQNASQVVTEYSKGPLINKSNFEREYIKDSPANHYCDKQDQLCKDLYAHLAHLKLFFTYDH